MSRTLLVTNDFPPRRGGIEAFVFSLCAKMPPAEVVVYTARMRGSAEVDESVAYPVVRDRARILLPTPRVGRAVRRVAREQGCDRVVFGAAAPLGLLAAGLRRAGVREIVGLTHGHEVWWAKVPVARQALRRIGATTDHLTYVSDYCRQQIGGALRPDDRARMRRLSPTVDRARFRPGLDGSVMRRRWGIPDGRPVVLAASRLVRRKGHDTLVDAWPDVLAEQPDALLLVVGDGPQRRRLQALARRRGVGRSVRFVPGVAWEEMPLVYAAADVFALPCRTRLFGLEPEAFGIVFLEAAACGLPVIGGDSGGAPEVVRQVGGTVVDARSPGAVGDAVVEALALRGERRPAADRPAGRG